MDAPKTASQVKEIPLPEGWMWKDGEAQLSAGGVLTAEAVYKDTKNYELWQAQLQIRQEAEIVASATDNTYTIGKDHQAVITCTGALAEFKGVSVDGVKAEASGYTLKEGSTILTFSKDYLDALPVGTHKVVLSYTAGDVETSLTVKKKEGGNENPPVAPPTDDPTENPPVTPPTDDPTENPPTNNPPASVPSGNNVQNTAISASGAARVKTGDDSSLWTYASLLFSAMGMMAMMVWKKKNKS